MNLEDILPLFEQAKSVGADRWIAQCPTHDDSRPSLSLRQTTDRVLVYCFGNYIHYFLLRALR